MTDEVCEICREPAKYTETVYGVYHWCEDSECQQTIAWMIMDDVSEEL